MRGRRQGKHSASFFARRVLVGVGLLVLFTAPYLVAWGQASDQWRFSGFLFNVYDLVSYVAKMRLGSLGLWCYRPVYTVEQAGCYYLYGPYLLLGHLFRNPDYTRLVLTFHSLRLAAGLFLAWSLWRFLGLYARGRARQVAWLLALLGGGLDWVPLLLQGETPLSWYSPEAFGYLMPLGMPHLALGRGLLLLLLTAWLHALEGRRTRPWLLGLAALFLGWVQPFMLLPLGLSLGLGTVWLFVQWRKGKVPRFPLLAACIALAAALFLWGAYLFGLQQDPFVRGWSARSVLPTPSVGHLAWAYAWVLPWVVLGFRQLWPEKPLRALLALAWLVTGSVLAYTPYPSQRRFLEGVWVAAMALSGAGMEAVAWPPTEGAGHQPRRAARLAALGLLLGGLVAPLFFYVQLFRVALQPAEPAFLPREAAAAYRAVHRLARPGDRVLTSQATGVWLPAWAPVRVTMGLATESHRLEVWQNRVRQVFQTPNDDARQRWLRAWGIRFMFYGPKERALGAWDPDAAAYLRLRFRQGAYAVYEVVP